MSAHTIPHNHLEIGYNGKHILISDQLILHILQVHMSMPEVVKVTLDMVVIATMDFTPPSYFSVMDINFGSVKMCWSGVVQTVPLHLSYKPVEFQLMSSVVHK